MTRKDPITIDVAVNEGQTFAISITGKDANGDAISTANIDSITVMIEDWHSRTLVTSKQITVANPASYWVGQQETRIINSERAQEFREVNVDFCFDTSNHLTEKYIYKVVNLGVLSVASGA